jgi:hypothetical protein
MLAKSFARRILKTQKTPWAKLAMVRHACGGGEKPVNLLLIWPWRLQIHGFYRTTLTDLF